MNLNGLRRYVLGVVGEYCSRLARMTQLSTSSETRYEHVQGLEQAATDPEVVLRARRMQHYGLSTRPPAGAEVVELLCGGSDNNRVTIAEYSGGPDDQQEGEVELFAATGQRIILRQNGDVVVIPKAGQKLLLGSADGTTCDPVVTTSQLNTCMGNIVNTLNGHTHGGVQTGTGSSGVNQSPLYSGYTVSGSPVASAVKP